MQSIRIAFVSLLLVSYAFAENDEETKPGFNETTFKGLEWRSIGPAFMSGRIADIAIHPERQSTWYVAVGSGGVWKTDNRGTTWEPLFDDEDVYSIGSLAIDPNDPHTIWVGTGENVSGRHVAYGAGIYRSLDGGKNWENRGLKNSDHIGMIAIDPRDSDTVFVAAQGPLWSGGGDRGLFKSTDGGATWRKVLGDGLGNTDIDDQYTGVSEVFLDPRDPDTMYAVSWQRLRTVAVLMDGGPGTGIHKSEDGGETWRKLTEGLPDEIMGKTGLAISHQDPDVLYATIELANREGGFWRSADGGETWEKKNDYLSGGTGPHYYQEIFASPHAFDRVYQMDVQMHVTEDGGENFENLAHDSKHSDHHAMAFDPNDPDYLLVGVDGGLYESYDLGENWRYIANLPITQFYKVSVDYDLPFYNVYGGTQDNNTQGGPSRTMSAHGITNEDWFIAMFGDGHQPAADPNNPDIVYVQWQQGNLARFDRATGEQVYIRPQAEEGAPPERYNWDAPIMISPHDSKTLFFGTQRVWRSDDHGDTWKAISGDLTRNERRVDAPLMGRTWSYDSPWDMYAMSEFNTVANLSQSPLDPDLIYVGTDDGLIQVTEDGGDTWRRIDELPGVPARFFVNDIKADLHDADTVYVVVDDYKSGDYSPYILKSEDRGRRWKSIASNLPDRHILWRVVQDHVDPDLLFLGSEFGVFFTVDGGGRWTELAGGVPTIAFRDLAIQKRENDLIGATFGRSFYILDDYSPLRNLESRTLEQGATLFPVRDAPWYVPRRDLGCSESGCKASQGDAFYVAENPDFGAILTYYLADTMQTSQEQRRESEKEKEKKNRNVRFPDFDTIIREAREDAPAIVLTIRDASGEIVRNIEAPAESGFHRVAWDLRYAAVDAWSPDETEDDSGPGPGVMVAPGEFTVSMARRENGVLTAVDQTQPIRVVSIRPAPAIEGMEQQERVVFDRRLDELYGAVAGTQKAIDRLAEELTAVKQVLSRGAANARLYESANSIHERLLAQRDRLAGNDTRNIFHEWDEVSVTNRLWHARFSPGTNVYGPTPAQRESFRIASARYAEISEELDKLDDDYTRLKREMDAAGTPWTPGR